ncbi:MAG: TIGR03086 family protein [Micromonosporaceae bacterium]|nr:TIGR03086 family protein [Micromonosporaceae bacterium]
MDQSVPILERFRTASEGFARRLAAVEPHQWTGPTPCSEWNVRQLVNHMARGNLNYVDLAAGGSAADFIRQRDLDALGDDPVGGYAASVEACAAAFAEPGALDRMVDHPLGRTTGRQALAVRTTDSTIHTWDLARAIGADEDLDPGLVAWIAEHLDQIYAGLVESPVDPASTHRFFAAPAGTPEPDASRQQQLLHLMGRTPVTALPGST